MNDHSGIEIAAPILIDPAGALKVEIGYLIACIILILLVILDTKKRGELGQLGLCAIAGFSIWWQELYADWGGYLLWSDSFHMMPWGESMWTTPDKPWFLLASYPVFMTLSVSLMLWLCRGVLKVIPNFNQKVVCFFTAGITLIIINTLLELASVSSAGQWTYVDTIGPVINTAHGLQPLLYPNIPFGTWGGVICALILSQSALGRPRFENIVNLNSGATGWRLQGLRAVVWVVVWNVTYWLFLCTPLITMRLLWGAPNVLVP